MAEKSNYSEVQRMDRTGTIKKIVFILVLLVVIFVALTVVKMISGGDKETTTTKQQQSATLSMVPTTTYYYDPQSEKTYDVGVNYVILADENGYLKVDSTGNVTRVSSDGSFLSEVTVAEKNSALAIAKNIIQSDTQASMALEGLESSKNYTTTGEVTVAVAEDPLEKLYAAAEALGYDRNSFIKQLYLTGSSPEAAAVMLENGFSTDTIVKSVMSKAATTESEKADGAEKPGITATVEKLGLDNSTQTVVSTEETSSYPSWLEDSDPTAGMTALVEALTTAAGTGTSTTTKSTTWNNTNRQEEKTNWQDSQQSTEVTATKLTRYDLVAGTTVPITIVTGVNTDLPGQIVGLVRQDVYDSLTGTNVIIPKGSRLIATYNSSVSFGQKSIQIAWNQLITTDGYQFSLPGFNGTTPDGYSGVSGNVNNHFWQMLGGAVFGSIIDWGAAYAKDQSSNIVSGSVLSVLVSGIASSAIDTTSSVGQQYASLWLNLQPTITIKTGTQTQLLVNQTISLKRPTTSYVTNSF